MNFNQWIIGVRLQALISHILHLNFGPNLKNGTDYAGQAETLQLRKNVIPHTFVAASHQHGQVIRAFGVTPRLLIDDFKCAPGGACAGRVFTMRELQHESMLTLLVRADMSCSFFLRQLFRHLASIFDE